MVTVLGKFWLLLEVNGMEIVVGVFIWKKNRVMFGQKRVTIGLYNGQKFEKSPKTCHVWAKRDTIHHVQNFLAQKSCHVLANVSRFGNVERTSILT